LAQIPPGLLTESLRIVSPPDGAVFSPGQPITVVVEVAGGNRFTHIGVAGEGMLAAPKAAPAFHFALTVPRSFIGQKKLTAYGIISPGKALFSRSVTIKIETRVTATELRVNLRQIDFKFAGSQSALNVRGFFADGTRPDITKSAGTTFRFENPAVAIVDAAVW